MTYATAAEFLAEGDLVDTIVGGNDEVVIAEISESLTITASDEFDNFTNTRDVDTQADNDNDGNAETNDEADKQGLLLSTSTVTTGSKITFEAAATYIQGLIFPQAQLATPQLMRPQ